MLAPRLFLQIAIISLFSCFRPSLSFATPLVALVSPICALNRESYNVQKFGLCHFAPLHISVYPLIFALLVEREYRRRFFVFPPECENERKYPVWSAAPQCTLLYIPHTHYAINLLELENIVWIHYYCFHFIFFRKALRAQMRKLSKGSPY